VYAAIDPSFSPGSGEMSPVSSKPSDRPWAPFVVTPNGSTSKEFIHRGSLISYRFNKNAQGFVKGAYAAAIGTILGASLLLGRIAIGDWLIVLIGLVSLAVLFRWKVSNPSLMAAAAGVGLIAYPLLHPAWVMVQ
jgi:hypothetical protein